MTKAATVQTLPFWKRALFAFILLVVFPALLILGAEGFGRVIIYWKYGVPGKSYGLWQADPEFGAIHASNAYNSNSETNSLGFRNKENVFEPKPAGALRVIAYGGSTTFCYNLETDKAWPIRLQLLLRSSHNPKDQVMNAGAIMWSHAHEYMRAKRDLPRLKPDVVLIYSGINEEANAAWLRAEGFDFERAAAEGKHGLFTKTLDQARWLKRNSLLVRYWEYVAVGFFRGSIAAGPEASHTLANPNAANDVAYSPLVSKHFNATLGEFIKLVKANGAKPVYVIVGGLEDVGANRRLLRYSKEGVEVARQYGVQIVDSNDVITAYQGNKRDLFAESGVHWSEKGAQLFAVYLEREIFAKAKTD